MATRAELNPTGRFGGVARDYARSRPSYPEPAIDWMLAGIPPGAAIADVGCGTGILSRALAARGYHVVGVEPNEPMRLEAEQCLLPASESLRYVAGHAESTGLDDESVALVVAAQAFHWFDAEAALREFHRLLRPGGRAVLLWNEADGDDPFSGEFWRIMQEEATDPSVVRDPFHFTGRVILTHPLFDEVEKCAFSNCQQLDEPAFIRRAQSASFAPRESPALERFVGRLREHFGRFERGGRAELRYQTVGFAARRRPAAPPA